MKVSIAFLLGAALLSTAMGRDLGRLNESHNIQAPNHRIVNGYEVVPHSLPYMVFLDLFDHWGFRIRRCGGVLISENYVLTAAGCTRSPRRVEVVLGAHSLKNPESTKQTFTATETITHRGYMQNYEVSKDIGLIKLPQPAVLNSAVNVISLSSLSDEELVGKVGTVSGWGSTVAGEPMSDVLRSINVTISEDSACEVWNEYVSEDQICSRTMGPCGDDRGGPLVVDGKLVGLVSFGACDAGNAPHTYTRIPRFLAWIRFYSDIKID